MIEDNPSHRRIARELDINRETVGNETGRFSHALIIPDRILCRSNGSLRPSRLITRMSARSISSYVVKRCWHTMHSRLRRIDAPSFETRESITLSSRLPHLGQRINARELADFDGYHN